MKKCPYCKADIQERARFCLYCMKSLDEKKPVPPSKKRKLFPLIAVAVLLAALLLVLVCCMGGTGDTLAGKEQGSMTPDEVILQESSTVPTGTGYVEEPEETEAKPQETGQTEQPPIQTEPTQPIQTEPTESTITQKPTDPTETPTTAPTVSADPVPTTCPHRYQITEQSAATCTADGSSTYTCSLCGDSHRESLSATGHRYQAATCLLPQICTVCEATGSDALGHSYQSGACIRCQKADPNDPRNIYEYREARVGDCDTCDPETDIVITGIKLIADDGVYEIPATINGKRVVAIRPLAFSDSNARKVTLGKNLIYVAQDAFSGCYNIEKLYIRAEYLFLSRSAFIPASSRNCTLKIYCSTQCTVDDDLYGDCYLKDIVRVYGGEFYEWNG